ncbi:hypothetical protein HYV69_01400 [Candidatus Uhrbacteria bacterium]|nr:hypothetical protein [Candidatus Uhrbacteria bacterium]
MSKEIQPSSALSISMLGKDGEKLFSVGALLTTDQTETTPITSSKTTSTTTPAKTDTTKTTPATPLSTIPVSTKSSNTNMIFFAGLALAVVGGGLVFASRSNLFSIKPAVGAVTFIFGGLFVVYGIMFPRLHLFTWSCPLDCVPNELRCRVSYAVTTSTDSISTEEKNELEAQKTIDSLKLLELPFKALDDLDIVTADSVVDAYKEMATALLGIPDTTGEVIGSSIPGVGKVVDLDEIEKFAQALHSTRVFTDRATGGMQLFAHFEQDQCEMSSCWVVSNQTSWKRTRSWFVPLTPERVPSNPYQHPLFSQQKANGVYLWTPSVLQALNRGDADAVINDIAKQTYENMPEQCK